MIFRVSRCIGWENKGNNILAESKDSGDDGGEPWLPRQFEFLSGLPIDKRKGRYLAIIQAWIDDSGVKGTDPVFVLAGFIARADLWAKFSDEWSKTLNEWPTIEYLKMNEAAKLDGQFRGWSVAARDEKLRKLVAVLVRNAPRRAIHFTYDTADFQKYRVPRILPPIADPYFEGACGIMAGVCYDEIDLGVPEEVEIIFDEHSIFRPRLHLWYPLLKARYELYDPALKGVLPMQPLFKDDKKFVPLQAADVVAWLFRTAFSGQRTEFEWIASALTPLVPMSNYRSIFTAERMNRINAMNLDFPIELIRQWEKDIGIKISNKQKMVWRKKMKANSEFNNFDRTMRELIKVPHSEIKAKLDAEKRAKEKRKTKRPSASSDHGSDEKD